MRFDADTYVVLDVPEPVAGQVMAVRVRHRDEFRASLPVEITVIGSSGIGVFDAEQDPDAAFATLDAVGRGLIVRGIHPNPLPAEGESC